MKYEPVGGLRLVGLLKDTTRDGDTLQLLTENGTISVTLKKEAMRSFESALFEGKRGPLIVQIEILELEQG